MQASACAQVSGHFRLLVGKPGEAPRVDTGWFDNLILDAGLSRMMGNADYLSNCQVGTGNSTPTAGQTQLDARIAGRAETAADAGNSGAAPYYAWARKTFAFAVGAVVGNVAEVGVGWSATTLAALFSRALVTVGGVPTTITVLAAESLTVIYELRLYPQASDSTATVSAAGGVDSTARTWTTRGCAVGTNNIGLGWLAGESVLAPYSAGSNAATLYSGSISPATGTGPSGALGSVSTYSYAVTGAGTGTITVNFPAGTGTGSPKSLRVISYACAWQTEASVAYSKTATRRLSVTISVTVTRRP